MNRRELLGKLPVLLVGPALLKSAACTTEIDGGPAPGGGAGTGSGGGGGPATEFGVSNSDTSGHTHMFWIECDQRGAGPWTYVAEGPHTHEVSLSAEQLDAVFRGEAVTVETTAGHPHTWLIQMPPGMCPPDDPGGSDDGGSGGSGGW